MFNHADRKSNEIIFIKCTKARCDFCSTNPIKATKVWDYLKEREFKWPNPIESQINPGHYLTFIEMEDIDTEFLKTGIVKVLRCLL